MDKASGVYLTISDESIQVGGTQNLNIIVPMVTVKGDIENLNVVTIDNFKDVLGYDLKYNSRYVGLERILNSVSQVKVWRINQHASLANARFVDKISAKSSVVNARNIYDVIGVDESSKPLLAVGNKFCGDWQTTAVKFAPTEFVDSCENQNAVESNPQIIELNDVSDSETKLFGTRTINGGCVFYNSTDNLVVGVIIDDKVYKVVDGEIESDFVGTATFEDKKLKISLTSSLSDDTFWKVHTIPYEISDWNLVVAEKVGNAFNVQKTYEFSVNPESEIFFENVDFGDLFVSIKGSLPQDWNTIRDFFTLDEGSNGDKNIKSINLDTKLLINSGCNILIGNQVSDDFGFINKIASVCHSNHIHGFFDTPICKNYSDVEAWAKKIISSEYVVVCSRHDTTKDENDKIIYIAPSTSYAYIYANMMKNHGSLCFMPAGNTYGTIAVENLMDCDFEMYKDYLKTNRVNWQRARNNGIVMWEDRTKYALNSDLSYINSVFIVDALREQIVDFEENFNFRYITRDDLINQDSGLTAILDDFITKNFLYSYTLKVPTYDEAQKSGRTVKIRIEIVIMKDGQVINIDLVLKNA